MKPNISGIFQQTILVPKPNNKWRPILDLSKLNLFLKAKKFKMETPKTIRTSLQQGEWVTSIDFKDAYFHILIQEQSRKYRSKDFMSRVRHTNSRLYPLVCPQRPWLGGEFRQIRIGTKTGFRLCRLPVRLQGRSGLTDTRPLAESSGQNIRNTVTTGLSSSAVHVSDRFTNSHRKASSPRPTSYETHRVASQKQLKGTRVTRKGDPNTKVLTPTFTMVGARGQRPYRTTITPNNTCSANLYRRIKRRVGCSLKRTHCKRHLVPSGKQTAYQLPRTQGSFSSLKRVPRPLHTQDSTRSNRQHHSGVIHKQGRRP